MFVPAVLAVLVGDVRAADSLGWRSEMQSSTKQFAKTVGSCVQFARTVDVNEVDILALKLVFFGGKPKVQAVYQSYIETWIGECVAKAARSWDWPKPPETPVGVLLPIGIQNFKPYLAADLEFAPPGAPDVDTPPRLPLVILRQYIMEARAAFSQRCLTRRVAGQAADLSGRLVLRGKVDDSGELVVSSSRNAADAELDACAVASFGAVNVPPGYGASHEIEIEIEVSGEGGEYALANEKDWSWSTLTSVRWAETGQTKPIVADPYLWLYAAEEAVHAQIPEVERCFLSSEGRDIRVEGLLVVGARGEGLFSLSTQDESIESLACARDALARVELPATDEPGAVRFRIDRFGDGLNLLDGMRYVASTDLDPRFPAGLLRPTVLAACEGAGGAYSLVRQPGMVHQTKAIARDEARPTLQCVRLALAGDDAPVEGPGSHTVFTIGRASEDPPISPPIAGAITWSGTQRNRRMTVGNYGLDQASTLVPSLSANVQACAGPAGAATGSFRGSVSLSIDLDGTGKIGGVQVVGYSLPKTVVTCAKEAVEAAQFIQPIDAKPAHFVWTWTLESGG